MPHDRDSPHHTPYKDAHHIRGSISQGNLNVLLLADRLTVNEKVKLSAQVIKQFHAMT